MELQTNGRGGLGVAIDAADDSGLRATVLLDCLQPTRELVLGQELQGNAQVLRLDLPASVIHAGRAKIEAFVTDNGGNVSRVTSDFSLADTGS